MQEQEQDQIVTFVKYWEKILNPKNVIWILDDDEDMTTQLIKDMQKRNEKSVNVVTSRKNCYAFRSNPNDVARMESKTFICNASNDAGPINNTWMYDDCLNTMNNLLCNVMTNRTMYVIPFCLGAIGNKYSRYGIQITDSEYVCMNMKIMCRVGQRALDAMNPNTFTPCIHSVGACDFNNMEWANSEIKYICHFMDEVRPFIISYGSGYGGNALLSKKCLALRVASVLGRREGWLAEHCLLLKMTSPQGEIKYIAAAFPSACGKTNLAMITPCKELMDDGWMFETIGDDIVWMHVIDGKLYAQNVENGFFGVAPGTNSQTNQHAVSALSQDCIFTNCATHVNEKGELDVWWEGLTSTPPADFINWKGERNVFPAAHSNARYTCPIKNCPILASNYEDLVPIHAIIFGGRRKNTIPLVTKAPTLQRGIFFGATLSSEETSANIDAKIGNVRFDPMAMRPFIGYSVCDYFQHWHNIMNSLQTPVEFYLVNWFRKSRDTNQYIWNGFSENSKILKWIFNNATETNVVSDFGQHPRGCDIYINNAALWDDLFLINQSELKDFKSNVETFFNSLDSGNVPSFLWNELISL